jgi:hypothetical protein
MLCPKCKTDNAHRSHRVGLWEHIISIAGYHPYRCRNCKHRFVSSRYAVPEGTSPATRSVEREISHTQSSFRWKRKKRDIILYGSALIVFGVILYLLTRPPKIGP